MMLGQFNPDSPPSKNYLPKFHKDIVFEVEGAHVGIHGTAFRYLVRKSKIFKKCGSANIYHVLNIITGSRLHSWNSFKDRSLSSYITSSNKYIWVDADYVTIVEKTTYLKNTLTKWDD
jgi:hypothetical protein